MQMDVDNTLYPFYIIKKMSHSQTVTKLRFFYGNSHKNYASLAQQCFFFTNHTGQNCYMPYRYQQLLSRSITAPAKDVCIQQSHAAKRVLLQLEKNI